MTDDQFRQILTRFDRSWAGYRKVRKGVKKRLDRHMSRLQCRNVAAYLHLAETHMAVRDEVELLLTVSISRFFRDRRVWSDVRDHILPKILAAKPRELGVWSAGCASGEEPYSFALVWEEFSRDLQQAPILRLLATDVNPRVLDRARKGVFSAGSLKEVSRELIEKHFTQLPDTGELRISDHLRAYMTFRIHDLLRDEPPTNSLHVIFLRNNVLTYTTGNTQKTALRRVVESLAPGGYLVVGSHEKVPGDFRELRASGFNACILRKESQES